MKTNLKSVVSREFITLLIIALVFSSNIHGQKLIARQSSTATTFHTTLDDAVTQANNEDILYIPGGYFDLTVPITKRIHIFGEGHNPKYSVANGTTIIGGPAFLLSDGSSGSTIQGVYFNSTVMLDLIAKNISFSRCNIEGILYAGSDGHFREYLYLTECIVRGLVNCDIQYGEFNNCIFQSYFFRHHRSHNFRNCVFLTPHGTWGHPYDSTRKLIDYSRFEKCIFQTGLGNAALCYMYNCISHHVGGVTGEIPLDGTNLIGGNNKYVSWDEIFETNPGETFTYDKNYHVKIDKLPSGIPSDIGIYGGPSPWKDNCFPMNPQILYKKVPVYTDASGNLKVEIRVEAQQR